MKTNNTLSIIGLAFSLLLICGSVLAQTNPIIAQAKKQIAAANATYFEGFAKNNPTLFTNHYTTDCWIMPPNEPSLCGPDAAQAFFKTAHTHGVRNGKLITIDVYGVSKDIVAEVGFFRLINAGNQQFDDGKCNALW